MEVIQYKVEEDNFNKFVTETEILFISINQNINELIMFPDNSFENEKENLAKIIREQIICCENDILSVKVMRFQDTNRRKYVKIKEEFNEICDAFFDYYDEFFE